MKTETPVNKDRTEPYKNCPRYAKCSVNNCPLHPDYPNLYIAEGDKDKKCGIAKAIRTRISANFPGVLKLEGLTPKEHQARKVWLGKTYEEQQKTRQKLAEISMFKAVVKERYQPEEITL